MNELNHPTLKACKRLHEAGIVMETEAVWRFPKDGIPFLTISEPMRYSTDVPVPSMAELLRDLPHEKVYHEDDSPLYEHAVLVLEKLTDHYRVGYPAYHFGYKMFDNTNPADALIDLRIWLRVEEHKRLD